MWLNLCRRLPLPFNREFALDADAFDGCPSHRADLMGYRKERATANVVAIRGDLHTCQCGVVRDESDPAPDTPVMVDFVGAGIIGESLFDALKRLPGVPPLDTLFSLSDDFFRLVRGQNADLAFADFAAQGYPSDDRDVRAV
jgi:alkaline phosphatase D